MTRVRADRLQVMVAMSGGVDSSVAAALMVEAGHDVTGVTLKLRTGPSGEAPLQGCCTAADAIDARRVADALGIPYYVFDVTDAFEHAVVAPFVAAYRSGLTPNPCVECNREVKFSHLMERAGALGMDVLVTGHHVRRRGGPDGTFRLLAARDPEKDQSYVLHMLGQSQLARCAFPVGEMTKADVRATARRLGLRTADKAESQDVCFVGRGGVRSFLRGALPAGAIVERDGRVLGHHDGAVVTVGQRRGLGVATGRPRFVTEIRPGGTIVVGDEDDLASTSLRLERRSWVSGRPPSGPVAVRVRYRGPLTAAVVRGGEIELLEPVWAAAPGQSAVFYAGEEMLGGGVIAEAR